MADGAMVVVWGNPVRGREQQALEVFGEALALYERLQRSGEIESFEPIALEPNGGPLAGLLIVRGDPERLSRIRASAEYLRLNNRSVHIVEHFGVHTGFLGERLQQLYADWGVQGAALAREQHAMGTPVLLPS